jgi:hypothetical protein
MKKNTPIKVLFVLVIIMIIVSVVLTLNQQQPVRPGRSVRPRRTVHWATPIVTPTPEFRPPPEKVYKPPVFQQMGLLTKDDGTILPLYGKESTSHRDRYNFYTTTPGNQVYSLPISHDNRDCTEDIGCNEFYGKENVSVTGMDGTFSTQIYRNKNMRLM